MNQRLFWFGFVHNSVLIQTETDYFHGSFTRRPESSRAGWSGLAIVSDQTTGATGFSPVFQASCSSL